MVDPVRTAYWNLTRAFRRSQRVDSPKSTFSTVYRNRVWGAEGDFNSGSGSHDMAIVGPYIAAVRTFLDNCQFKTQVVDIGCGDFNVGSRLVSHANSYVACDIVPDLIKRNRRRYVAPNLRFEIVNAIDDPLPPGNIVCVRQVLQHLSNRHIQEILTKLAAFPYWIITEHIPAEPSFQPNVDKLTDENIRMGGLKSGVVLTAAPFNVRPKQTQVLCEAGEISANSDGIIQTTLYCF
jgi:hypothetical protein